MIQFDSKTTVAFEIIEQSELDDKRLRSHLAKQLRMTERNAGRYLLAAKTTGTVKQALIDGKLTLTEASRVGRLSPKVKAKIDKKAKKRPIREVVQRQLAKHRKTRPVTQGTLFTRLKKSLADCETHLADIVANPYWVDDLADVARVHAKLGLLVEDLTKFKEEEADGHGNE